MRTIEEIMADMAEIMAQATLTPEDVATYLALEAELAAAQQAAGGDTGGDGDGEGEPAAPVPAPAAPGAHARVAPSAVVAAMRGRHAAYNTVVVPAGRPSNSAAGRGGRDGRGDAQSEGFRNYLRTGRANSDMQTGPQNAQSTTGDTSGGYLVPDGFLARIVEVVKSYGGIFNDAEQLTTDSGNPLPMPTNDDTANQAAVAAEGAAPATGADLVFGQVMLSAFEYAASGASGNPLKVPIALVQDSAFDIEAYIAKKLGVRIARKMANDAVLGNGTGQAQGVLQAYTGATTASTTLAYGDLVDLVMSLDPLHWATSKWYMSATSLGIVSKMVDASNALIFRPGLVMIGDVTETRVSGAIQVGPVLAPVVIDNAMPNFAASAKWGIFGDITEGYIWRTVRAVEVLVNPYSSANSRQIEYNAWARADGRQKDQTAYKLSTSHA